MADTAPRSRVGGSAPARDKRPPTMTRNQIADEIAQQVTMAGTAVGMADPVGGFILLTNAEPFSDAWAEVAAVNPRVKLVLESWFSRSVYANAGLATAGMLLPLLTHYKLLPRAWFNPAGDTVTMIETMMAPAPDGGAMTLADMLKMHKEAQMAGAAESPNGSDPEVADHFEVPAE